MHNNTPFPGQPLHIKVIFPGSKIVPNKFGLQQFIEHTLARIHAFSKFFSENEENSFQCNSGYNMKRPRMSRINVLPQSLYSDDAKGSDAFLPGAELLAKESWRIF